MSKSFYMINQNTCTRVKLYGIDVKNIFLINGYIEDNKEKSNYIIINTCSFLKTKEEYISSLESVSKRIHVLENETYIYNINHSPGCSGVQSDE